MSEYDDHYLTQFILFLNVVNLKNNILGLINAYQLEQQNETKKRQALEENLNEATSMLENAKSRIECEKAELSTLETVRKDLEAQRSFFTQGIQDSDIKGFRI